MAFNLICETTGPAVKNPIGVMGDETTQGESRAVPRYDENGDVTTALTAADYAILPFSYVVQSLPSKDEFSGPHWNQNFVGNVPTIFGNFYRRSFDPDTCALGPAGVSQDGIDDPEAAQEDPIAAARTAILLHGTTSMLADDRFFRHAFLGMYVELIPTDSGLRPEGYSQYGTPLMRPVLAEHIRGTVYYNSSAPTMALVAAGYEYLGTDDMDQKLAADDRVALLAEIWQLCKVPSMPTKPRKLAAGCKMTIDGKDYPIASPYDRMKARSVAVSKAINISDPCDFLDYVYHGKDAIEMFLNPFSIFPDEILKDEHENAMLLGSPACPSILMHLYRFLRTKVSYIFSESEPVYERCPDSTPESDRINRWGSIGELVEWNPGTALSKKFYQHPIKTITDYKSFHTYIITSGSITVPGGSGGRIDFTVGIDIKKRNELVSHLRGGISEDITLSAFGDIEDLADEDKDILKDAATTIHAKAQVPIILLHMAHTFKDHVFFLDHPYLGEFIRDGGKGSKLKLSDATHVTTKYSGGEATITLEAALGSLAVGANDVKSNAAVTPYEFLPYKAAPGVRHPIIDNLMELMPTRKRQRDLDLHNARTLREESLEKVLSELDRRPVRSKWIIGEFITVESRNTIRICLRKPFVYM